MLILKQSTAATVKIGPFVDEDDGKTAETGLTLSQADIRLSKNGGDMAQKNDSSACTHDELGWYDCDLDTTDTNTLGRLWLMVHESGALPVWHEYMVLPANVYDSLVSGSDYLNTNDAGAGAITFTYTLTSSEDASPIPDARVWVTSDEAGSNILASGRTDASGEVTFYLAAGTVYVWRQKSGWDFTNPDTETVS